jgi:hypothetical protein
MLLPIDRFHTETDHFCLGARVDIGRQFLDFFLLQIRFHTLFAQTLFAHIRQKYNYFFFWVSVKLWGDFLYL